MHIRHAVIGVVSILALLAPASLFAQVALTADTVMQYCPSAPVPWKGGTPVSLDGNGLVSSGVLARDESLRWCTSESAIWKAGTRVTFRMPTQERCQVLTGTLAVDTKLPYNASGRLLAMAGTLVTFQTGPTETRCRVASATLAEDTGLHTTTNVGDLTLFKAGTIVTFDSMGLVMGSVAPPGGVKVGPVGPGGGGGGGGGGGKGSPNQTSGTGDPTRTDTRRTGSGSEDTTKAASGYWQLERTENNQSLPQSTNPCFVGSSSGGQNSGTYKVDTVCGEPRWTAQGSGTWSSPPAVLVPGRPLQMSVSVEANADPRLLFGMSVFAEIDAERCGYSRDGIRIVGVGASNDPNAAHAAKKQGSAPVPDHGWGSDVPALGGRLKVRACVEGWAAYWYYVWRSGPVPPGGTEPTATTPTAQDPTQPTSSTDRPQAPGPSAVIFDNGNPDVVSNGPTSPTVFTIGVPTRVTRIVNYHWNGGRGGSPGRIAILDGTGRQVGSWEATGNPGDTATPAGIYWEVRPNVVLQPGTYTITDTVTASWSFNQRSGGAGMTKVEGVPVR